MKLKNKNLATIGRVLAVSLMIALPLFVIKFLAIYIWLKSL